MEALNMDCVRDLLLLIEKETTVKMRGKSVPMKLKHLYPMLDSYSSNQKHEAARYIFGKQLVVYDRPKGAWEPRFYVCTGLSPLGHDYLAKIRNDTVWKRMKSFGKDLSALTVKEFLKIAIQAVAGTVS